ncbi:recombinase family protein [Amycolatopsis sp. NPDC023774]|uniref:recombinase family protein n=1 Tax=Amycolatopsis sp. NPDC023774 TaxID=3155015 RepID=UPI0033D86B41
MFAQRATGRSVAGIARELNERGVPCPSRADQDRNRHRTKHEWIVRTVAGILENPRYRTAGVESARCQNNRSDRYRHSS